LLCAQTTATEADRRLRRFVGAAMALAAVGFAVGWLAAIAPQAAASILRLYWFRLSDILVPLGTVLVGFQFPDQQRSAPRTFVRFAYAALVVLWAYDVWNQGRHFPWLPEDWGRASSRSDKFLPSDDWRDACHWAAENTPPDSVFLTPRQSSTFKWYTGRG